MFEVMFPALLILLMVVMVTKGADNFAKEKFGKWVFVVAVAISLVIICLKAHDYSKSNISVAKLEVGVVYETASVTSVADDEHIVVLKLEKGDHIVRRLGLVPPKYFIVAKNGSYVRMPFIYHPDPPK